MEILEDDIEELKIDNLVGEQGELSYTVMLRRMLKTRIVAGEGGKQNEQ